MTTLRKKNKITERGHQGKMVQKARNIFFFAVGVMGKLHTCGLFVGLLEISPCSQAGHLIPWRGGFGRGPGATEAGSPT